MGDWWREADGWIRGGADRRSAPVLLQSWRWVCVSTTYVMHRSISDLRGLPVSLFSCLIRVGFNFSSSGREDVDVRTLGNGKTHTRHFFHTNFALYATQLRFVSKRSCVCFNSRVVPQVDRSLWSFWTHIEPNSAELRSNNYRRCSFTALQESLVSVTDYSCIYPGNILKSFETVCYGSVLSQCVNSWYF